MLHSNGRCYVRWTGRWSPLCWLWNSWWRAVLPAWGRLTCDSLVATYGAKFTNEHAHVEFLRWGSWWRSVREELGAKDWNRGGWVTKAGIADRVSRATKSWWISVPLATKFVQCSLLYIVNRVDSILCIPPTSIWKERQDQPARRQIQCPVTRGGEIPNTTF